MNKLVEQLAITHDLGITICNPDGHCVVAHLINLNTDETLIDATATSVASALILLGNQLKEKGQ